MSAVIKRGLPMAATRISARRVCAARSAVRLWQMVTVAFSCKSSSAMGLPTMLLRPTTTASLPLMGIPARLSMCSAPFGVQATTQSSPRDRRPALISWKPSTSFSGRMSESARSPSRWRGRGSCTRMPLTDGSALASRMASSSVSWVVSAGMRSVRERIPRRAQAFSLLLT